MSQAWLNAVVADLGATWGLGAPPDEGGGVSFHPADEDDAKWVVLGAGGEPVVHVRLSMELDEERFAADPEVEEALFEAVRDLEGLELSERGYVERAQALIGLTAEEKGPVLSRVAEVLFERRVDDPLEAAAEVRWLFGHLGFAFPYEEE